MGCLLDGPLQLLRGLLVDSSRHPPLGHPQLGMQLLHLGTEHANCLAVLGPLLFCTRCTGRVG